MQAPEAGPCKNSNYGPQYDKSNNLNKIQPLLDKNKDSLMKLINIILPDYP